MLKTTRTLQMFVSNDPLDARVFAINKAGDIEVGDGSKCIKSKTGRSESQNLAKSQKLSKSRKCKGEKSKKPSKSENSSNFNATKAGPSFLTPGARKTFNRLQLAFTETQILKQFDPKYHIQIKADALGSVINSGLSQLLPKLGQIR